MKFAYTMGLASLAGLTYAQSMGNGMSKYTFASSDPRTCLTWMETHLTAEEDGEDCRNG
jgi:hypothetical protein